MKIDYTLGKYFLLCGLSKNMIGLYECGKKTPSMKSVVALADFLGVSVDTLCGCE